MKKIELIINDEVRFHNPYAPCLKIKASEIDQIKFPFTFEVGAWGFTGKESIGHVPALNICTTLKDGATIESRMPIMLNPMQLDNAAICFYKTYKITPHTKIEFEKPENKIEFIYMFISAMYPADFIGPEYLNESDFKAPDIVK